MGKVVAINQRRFFTLEDALELLPVVKRITKLTHHRVKQFNLELSLSKDKGRRGVLEQRIQESIEEWQHKIRKLGCEVKGMWLVDFDNGEGYYCWHYPESSIHFSHGYQGGYRGRVRIH